MDSSWNLVKGTRMCIMVSSHNYIKSLFTQIKRALSKGLGKK
jgi:hypothetical protein